MAYVGTCKKDPRLIAVVVQSTCLTTRDSAAARSYPDGPNPQERLASLIGYFKSLAPPHLALVSSRQEIVSSSSSFSSALYRFPQTHFFVAPRKVIQYCLQGPRRVMKYSTAIGLMAIFAGYALAANPTCTTSGDTSPINSSCCPRTPLKRSKRSPREIFARTDDPPTCSTPTFYPDSCCTHQFLKPQLVKDTFNLQCGANGVADVFANAVKVEIVGCDSEADLTLDTCYLMISSTPPGTITDTHLEISTTPWTSTHYPTQDPASWSYTSSCGKNTGVCQVPLKQIPGGATALCDKSLYVAYHTSTTDSTSSRTCTGDGTLIPGQPGRRWWEYLTLSFTCPLACDAWCCCEQPQQPSDCGGTGTAFAKPPSNAEQQRLNDVGCQRWGWTNTIATYPYTARLLVGAGNNVGGKDVGKVVVTKCATDDSKLTVTYTLDSPYLLNEVHVDLRCSPIVSKGAQGSTAGYPCAPGLYNVFNAAPDGRLCPASTGKSSWTISCIDPLVYDDSAANKDFGYTCTSTQSPMYGIFHASVYNSNQGCPVKTCSDTDAGENEV